MICLHLKEHSERFRLTIQLPCLGVWVCGKEEGLEERVGEFLAVSFIHPN